MWKEERLKKAKDWEKKNEETDKRKKKEKAKEQRKKERDKRKRRETEEAEWDDQGLKAKK